MCLWTYINSLYNELTEADVQIRDAIIGDQNYNVKINKAYNRSRNFILLKMNKTKSKFKIQNSILTLTFSNYGPLIKLPYFRPAKLELVHAGNSRLFYIPSWNLHW